MNKEEDRLKTFLDNGWTNSFVIAEELARVGFYYFKRPHVVKCAFCFVPIYDFGDGFNPLREHSNRSPNCPLIRRRITDNIPIDNDLLDQILPPPSYDVCGYTEVRRRSKIEEKIKHPEFKLLEHRLKSFKTWPIGIKQRPQELAEAGLFYSGQSDSTICFSCGLELSQWEPNDNAWVEHKKHAKEECDFLKINHKTVKLNVEKMAKVEKLQKVEDTCIKRDESPKVEFEALCKICLEGKSSVIFLPCRHVAVCGQCVFGIAKDCPICRTPIEEAMAFYYS